MSKMRTIAAVLAAAGLMSVTFADAAQGGAGGGGAGGGGAGGGGGAAGGGGGAGGGGKPAQCASVPVPGKPGTFIVTCSNKRP